VTSPSSDEGSKGGLLDSTYHLVMQSKDLKTNHNMIINVNNCLDRNGNLLYTRSFLHSDDHIQSSNESNDRFMRHLFHETKTPLQILLSIKHYAHFDSDDDYSAFVTAIDSLSTLTLDMSILCGNINNGQECISKDGK
jgi:hypothetical protein